MKKSPVTNRAVCRCALISLSLLVFSHQGSVFGAITSETSKQLKTALEQYPDADTNKDGVLTYSEATEYNNKHDIFNKKSKSKRNKLPKPQTASGKDVAKEEQIDGYNGLYMGHSFFRPAVATMLGVIPESKIVNHTSYLVFAGGPSGSPLELWNHEARRQAGQTYLDKGDIDLFAMTYFDEANSSVEHYKLWFDYALQKNPDIRFLVALPWEGYLGQASQESIDQAEEKFGKIFNKLIVPLRTLYPNNEVIYCPYGLAVYELAKRLKDGQLPGVVGLVNPEGKRSTNKYRYILNDQLGHGSQMVSMLSGLIFTQTIYDYDLSSIEKEFRADKLPEIDLNEIASHVYKKVRHYNEIYYR